jgi:hypothetical protein
MLIFVLKKVGKNRQVFLFLAVQKENENTHALWGL